MAQPFRLLRLASLLVLVPGLGTIAGLNQIRAGDPPAQRQSFADQQAKDLVKESIRQADRLVQKENALGLLKRTREQIRSRADFSEGAKLVLEKRLDRISKIIAKHGTGGAIRQKLNKPFQFAGYDDPLMTLEQVLQSLQKQHDVTFTIDHPAFGAIRSTMSSRSKSPRPLQSRRAAGRP